MLAVAATAQAILATVEAWYADPEHNARKLPERRYVAAGDPRAVAWDCDDGQVTVAFASTTLQTSPDLAGQPTMAPARNRSVRLIRSGSFELQIVRPAPGPGYDGEVPSAEVLSQHGLELLADVEQVIAMVNDAQARGTILPEGHSPAPVQVPIIEVIGPTGKLAGIAATIVVELL